MGALSTGDIDRELASRTQEAEAMSVTLLELENHPGLAHVRRYPPTGITAQRWSPVEVLLTQLWDDFGRLTSILDDARTVRARRHRPGDSERAELTKLLREQHLEVSRQRIPLARRVLTGPAEEIVRVGLPNLVERMRTAYESVAEFLDAVDQIDTEVVARLAPSQKLLDEAGAAGPDEVAELLAVSANDPLSLTPYEVQRRLTAIENGVKRHLDRVAEHAAIQANWPKSIAASHAQLDTLSAVLAKAAQARAHAERTVLSGPLPRHADDAPGLRAELNALNVPDIPALQSLRRRIDAALAVATEDHELAQGLLDRLSELKGRLSVYEAKAARVGFAEDRDLLACSQIATGLLARRPCDLRAVTRAIADYRQALLDKQGKTT